MCRASTSPGQTKFTAGRVSPARPTRRGRNWSDKLYLHPHNFHMSGTLYLGTPPRLIMPARKRLQSLSQPLNENSGCFDSKRSGHYSVEILQAPNTKSLASGAVKRRRRTPLLFCVGRATTEIYNYTPSLPAACCPKVALVD